jgi:hypothetical protein
MTSSTRNMMIDSALLGFDLTFLTALFLLHSNICFRSSRASFAEQKNKTITSRVKKRSSLAAMLVCFIEIVCLIIRFVLYFDLQLSTPVYRVLLVLWNFGAVLLVNEIFIETARILCSSLIDMVIDRLPSNLSNIGSRLKIILLGLELLQVVSGVGTKIAADIYYFSGSHAHALHSDHSPSSVVFKQIADKIFYIGIACNAFAILVCSLSFSYIFNCKVHTGKKVVLRTQTLLCSFNIFFFIQSAINIVGMIVKSSTSMELDSRLKSRINTLVLCCLILIQYLLMRNISDYSQLFLKNELEQINPEESNLISSSNA